MLDTRSNEWLARAQSNGPRIATIVLGALIAIELVRIAIALIAGGPVKSPQPVASHPPPHRQASGVDIQSVVAAHLFGVAEVDAANQDPANAPVSSASLILAGTIATQNPKKGVAIISDGGPAKVYSVGENIQGASLHSVYLDHVILDRNGSLETLLLPRQSADTGRPIVRRGMPPQDPRTAVAVDNIRRMVQQDPTVLDQVMRTVPSFDNQAGKLRGFRAYPGRNRAIFNKLGLKPGDLVTSINGTPLDDPQHSQDVFNTIQSSDHVTVTIERAGQKQDITLNIAQVAAQASKDLEGDGNAPPGGPGAPPGLPMPGPPPPGPPNSTNETSND